MTKMAERRLSGGLPASALAPSDPAAAAVKPSKLAAARSLVARGELVTLPGSLGQAWIQLIGHNVSNLIEAGTFKHMAELGLPAIALHGFSYDIQRTARTMHAAARDPDDHAASFGSLEDWQAESDDVLFACSLVYRDVKDRLDPSGSDDLPDETADEITEAFKKKDASRLKLSGVSSLVNWLLSGAVQLSSSPTPASNTGPDTPE